MNSQPDTEEPTVKSSVVKTLFLVRHGEAVHNVEEQRVKKRATEIALANGHPLGSAACRALQEEARLEALASESFRDAGLSGAGRAQALAARSELEVLSRGDRAMPTPTCVFVSPLQRTLQTAAILFPGHPAVHVREELRERKTGRPCDEPGRPRNLSRRPTFANMNFAQLLSLAAEEDDEEGEALPDEQEQLESSFDSEDTSAESRDEDPPLTRSTTNSSNSSQGSVTRQVSYEPEDSATLRTRTASLAHALADVEDSAICLITHKAFLRELERGPLGHPEAPEFGNCEVRVYDVLLGSDGRIAATQRHGYLWKRPKEVKPVVTTSVATGSLCAISGSVDALWAVPVW